MNFIRYFLTLLMFSVADKKVHIFHLHLPLPSSPSSFSDFRYKIFIQILHHAHCIIIKGFISLKLYICFQLTPVIIGYTVSCIFTINGFIKFNPISEKSSLLLVRDMQCHDFVMKCSTSSAEAHLVEVLHYKPEGCGFDSRWGHWGFSLI
jgi:hypothetical protein